VAHLQTEQQTAQAAENNAIEAYQCEADGSGPSCAGASDKFGKGPIYQAKLRTYQQDLAKLNEITSELNTATAQEQSAQKAVSTAQASTLAQEQASAQTLLPKLKKEYAAVNATLQSQANYSTKVNDGDNGLLAQIRALFAASSTDPALALVHLAVFLLFFMIEVLPVTVKLLLSMDKNSAYESVARKNENKVIDAAKIERAELRQIAEQKSQTRLAVEADMRKREINLGQHANGYVETAMTKILDAALQHWGNQVAAQLAATGQLPGGQPPVNGSPLNGSPPSSGSPPSGSAHNGNPVPVQVQSSTFFNLPSSGNLGSP
jgi:hypothetical protein